VFFLLIRDGLQGSAQPKYDEHGWVKVYAEDVDLERFTATVTDQLALQGRSKLPSFHSYLNSFFFPNVSFTSIKEDKRVKFLAVLTRLKKEKPDSFNNLAQDCLSLDGIGFQSCSESSRKEMTAVLKTRQKMLLDLCEGVESLRATARMIEEWPLVENFQDPTSKELCNYLKCKIDAPKRYMIGFSQMSYLGELMCGLKVSVAVLNDCFQKCKTTLDLFCKEKVLRVCVRLIKDSAFYGVHSRLGELNNEVWEYLRGLQAGSEIVCKNDVIIANDDQLKVAPVCGHLYPPKMLFSESLEEPLLTELGIPCFNAPTHRLKDYILKIATDSNSSSADYDAVINLLVENDCFMYFVCCNYDREGWPVLLNRALSIRFLLGLGRKLKFPLQTEAGTRGFIAPYNFCEKIIKSLCNKLVGFIYGYDFEEFDKNLMRDVAVFVSNHERFFDRPPVLSKSDLSFFLSALQCKDSADLDGLDVSRSRVFQNHQVRISLAQAFGFIPNPYTRENCRDIKLGSKLDPVRIMQTDLEHLNVHDYPAYTELALQVIADQISNNSSDEAKNFITKFFGDDGFVQWRFLYNQAIEFKSIAKSLNKIVTNVDKYNNDPKVLVRLKKIRASFSSASSTTSSAASASVAPGEPGSELSTVDATPSSKLILGKSHRANNDDNAGNAHKSHSLPIGGMAIGAGLGVTAAAVLASLLSRYQLRSFYDERKKLEAEWAQAIEKGQGESDSLQARLVQVNEAITQSKQNKMSKLAAFGIGGLALGALAGAGIAHVKSKKATTV